MPKFSIIIPTYNRVDNIRVALQSILNQTFQDYEILVMDDGSTDETASVIAEFKDNRIIYEWQQNSGGPARPRNRGIEQSKGEWICFLDADDWWFENKLSHLDSIINDDVDFIHHPMKIVNCNNEPTTKLLKGQNLPIPVFKSLLLIGNKINTSSVAIRKSILDKTSLFNDCREIIAAEDYNLWIQVSLITDKFLYISSVLGVYRECHNSLSKKDMSSVTQAASNDFLYLLNDNEKKIYFSNIFYIKAGALASQGFIKSAIINYYYAFKNGRLKMQLKIVFKFFFEPLNYLHKAYFR